MISSFGINYNPTASLAALNLNRAGNTLSSSLARLSTGFKINSPADDAGGLAVSIKIQSELKRNQAAQTNIANATSFLQTQDGALDTMNDVLTRISELKTLSTDATKSASEIADYDTEFDELKAQLQNLQGEKFNGVSVFSNADSDTMSVTTSADGTQTVNVTKANPYGAISIVLNAADLSDITDVATVTTATENVASLRAQNGAESNRLSFANDTLASNYVNLEAANSRIMDTDFATESTRFAAASILVNSSAASLVQANALSQVVLKLLAT